MMSGEAIREFQRKAAESSSRLRLEPFVVWPQDLADWKATVKTGHLPRLPFPFLGDYLPRGWEYNVDANGDKVLYFVDSSGFGASDEPAMTASQFIEKLKPNYGYAIYETGQFQVYVAEYRKAKHGYGEGDYSEIHSGVLVRHPK